MEDLGDAAAHGSHGATAAAPRTGEPVTPAIEGRLRSLVRAQPDVTLAELQQQLERDAGLHLSIGRLWLALQNMGLRLKKSHSTHKNKTASKSRRGGSSGGKR